MNSDVPATKDQMKVGVRVKCIYPSQYDGKTGTVKKIDQGSGDIYIIWDDGEDDTQSSGWEFASSFTILPSEEAAAPTEQPVQQQWKINYTPPTPPPDPSFDFDKYNRGEKQ